jgi:hypothetical protein
LFDPCRICHRTHFFANTQDGQQPHTTQVASILLCSPRLYRHISAAAAVVVASLLASLNSQQSSSTVNSHCRHCINAIAIAITAQVSMLQPAVKRESSAGTRQDVSKPHTSKALQKLVPVLLVLLFSCANLLQNSAIYQNNPPPDVQSEPILLGNQAHNKSLGARARDQQRLAQAPNAQASNPHEAMRKSVQMMLGQNETRQQQQLDLVPVRNQPDNEPVQQQTLKGPAVPDQSVAAPDAAISSLDANSAQPTDEPRVLCRVVIESRLDFHYEVLESMAMQYPLPWHRLDCGIRQTANATVDTDANTSSETLINQQGVIVFDFALTLNRLLIAPGEYESWSDYYINHLAGTFHTRTDGLHIQFGDLVRLNNYTHTYAAHVEASCDYFKYRDYLLQSDKHFCVLHTGVGNPKWSDEVKNRTCNVSPMHERCHFVPSNLPHFDKPARPSETNPLVMCIGGGRRNHRMFSDALKRLKPTGVVIKLHHRYANPPFEYRSVATVVDTQKVEANMTNATMSSDSQVVYNTTRVPDGIELHLIRESDFYRFQQSMATCHLMLPLLDPRASPAYFYANAKKLSGIFSQAIAHRTPTLMHQEHGQYFGPFMTARYLNYTDLDTFSAAMADMIEYIKRGGEDGEAVPASE